MTAKKLFHLKTTLSESALPLLRIVLVLRKFAVVIEKMELSESAPQEWTANFTLDLQHAPRTDTIFKKIAKFCDVTKVEYRGAAEEIFISLK